MLYISGRCYIILRVCSLAAAQDYVVVACLISSVYETIHSMYSFATLAISPQPICLMGWASVKLKRKAMLIAIYYNIR